MMDKRLQAVRRNKSGVKRTIFSGLVTPLIVFIYASGVYADSGEEETFVNSEPVYRNLPPASFLKPPPEKKKMENVRGLYYIVDTSSFMKADSDRSGEYRALGKTVFVEESLLTGKTGGKRK